jgi:methylphosphotriester-DNA--protein-cysteine methyltransferase
MASRSTPSSDHTRWLALVSRDRSSAKDTFVYAVRTTKIYCRPSCPSRLARRANVEFYDAPDQAEKAGYRACKRCKPELKNPNLGSSSGDRGSGDASGSGSGTRDPVAGETHLDYAQHEKMIAKACRAIREKGGVKRLKELSAEAGLTPSHFHRVFKKVTGVTPGEYGKRVREELNGEDYAKMVGEGLLWVEASPENWEAISELSAVISERENEEGRRKTSLLVDPSQVPERDDNWGFGQSLEALGVPASHHLDIATGWNGSAVDQLSNPYECGNVDDQFEILSLGFDDTSPTTPDVSLNLSEMDVNTLSMPGEISSSSPGGLHKDMFDFLGPRILNTSTGGDLTIFHPPLTSEDVATSQLDGLAMMDMLGSADVFSNSLKNFSTWT